MAIHYYDEHVRSGLRNKRRLSSFLKTVISEQLEAKTIAIDYIFCDDAYLLEKNITFLKHNTYTDIITFDLSRTESEIRSEIYISTERVHENAAKFEVSYWSELHRVIFHGVLHLCGFKDKSKADREQMRRMEDYCLEKYFSADEV